MTTADPATGQCRQPQARRTVGARVRCHRDWRRAGRATRRRAVPAARPAGSGDRAAGAPRRALHRQDLPGRAGQHRRGAHAALRRQWRAGGDAARARRPPRHPRLRSVRLIPRPRAANRHPLGPPARQRARPAPVRAVRPAGLRHAAARAATQTSARRPTATGSTSASRATAPRSSTPTSSASATSRSV